MAQPALSTHTQCSSTTMPLSSISYASLGTPQEALFYVYSTAIAQCGMSANNLQNLQSIGTCPLSNVHVQQATACCGLISHTHAQRPAAVRTHASTLTVAAAQEVCSSMQMPCPVLVSAHHQDAFEEARSHSEPSALSHSFKTPLQLHRPRPPRHDYPPC